MQTAWSREGVRKNGGWEVTVTGQEYPLKDVPGEIQFHLLLYNRTLAHGQVRSGGLWNNRPRQQRDIWFNNQTMSVKWSVLANCVGVMRNDGRKNSLTENALIENCKITKKTPKYVNKKKCTLIFMMYFIHNVATNIIRAAIRPSSGWCSYYKNRVVVCEQDQDGTAVPARKL